MGCRRLQAGSLCREGGANMNDPRKEISRMTTNETGESAATDSPANPNLNHPLNGDATNEHNQAD